VKQVTGNNCASYLSGETT